MKPVHLAALALMGCGDVVLKAINDPPTLDVFQPIHGQDVLIGEDLVLIGEVRDDVAGDIDVSWLVGGVEHCSQTLPVPANVMAIELRCTVSFANQGLTEIILQARDSGGQQAQVRVSVEVVLGTTPLVEITRPVGDERHYSGRMIEFEGLVSDREDGPEELFIQWSSHLDGPLPSSAASSSGSVLTTSALSEGEHRVTLSATDLSGNTEVDQVVVQVGPPNLDPSCAITTPEADAAYPVGTSMTLVGTVHDAETPPSGLDVTWTSSVDGPLGTTVPTTDGSVVLPVSLSTGTHAITLSAVDDAGGTCSEVVVVQLGLPPVLTVDAPTLGAVYDIGDPVGFEATATDPDTAPADLTITWRSDLDGLLRASAPDSAGHVQFFRSDLSRGPHILEVTASDPLGLTARTEVAFRIDGPPEAPTVQILPLSPATTDPLQAVVTSPLYDADGDPVSVTYQWRRDGQAMPITTHEVTAESTRRGELWSVEVVATDGRLQSPAATDEVLVVDTLPSVADVTIVPGMADTTDALDCVHSAATDPDDDAVDLTYAWWRDGELLAEQTGVLDPSETHRGDEIVCSVTPSGPAGVGAEVTSEAITISNSPPTLDAVAVSPVPLTSSDEARCLATGLADADGDDVTLMWSWRVDGALQALELMDALSATPARGQRLQCGAAASDGLSTGPTLWSAEVLVGNSPPGTPTIAIHPSAPAEGEELLCVATPPIDPDGDSVSLALAWTVDDTPYATSGGSTDTVPAADVLRSQTWTCTATASDGVATSAPVSASVSVSCVPSEESCDLLDSDCDGSLVDEFDDTDGDLLPDCVDDDDDDDGFDDDDDCAPTDPEAYPGAPEIIGDGTDQDCDGIDPVWCFVDADMDGWGEVCDGSNGPPRQGLDCVVTAWDGVCDGDEAAESGDCEDAAGDVNPDATEVCNGIDDDCAGGVDNGLSAPLAGDQDGVCAGSRKVCAGTLGWRDPVWSTIPGYEAIESSCDGLDNDCDLSTDEGLSAPLSSNQRGVCSGSRKVCAGASSWQDPAWSTVPNYQSPETACDSRDNDCDGSTDEGLLTRYYRDSDGDSYGNSGQSVSACTQPSGYVTNSRDCNDDYAMIRPGLRMDRLVEIYSPDRTDHMTTWANGLEYTTVTAPGRPERYQDATSGDLGWVVTDFGCSGTANACVRGNGDWTELRRFWSETTGNATDGFGDHQLKTQHWLNSHSVPSGYVHEGGLGWVPRDHLGRYPSNREFSRVFRDDGYQNHRMAGSLSHFQQLISDPNISDDGKAGYIFLNNESCP